MAAILADDNFKCIFLNENDCIPIQISLKFLSRNPIYKKPALIQVMPWRQTGESNYLNQCWSSEPTHICGTTGDEITLFAPFYIRPLNLSYVVWVKTISQCLYLLNGRTSHRKISWSLEGFPIALKFRNHISAAEMLVKFRSDTIIIASNLAASKLPEIWP